VRGFLGRVSEWAVTHPAQTIAGVVSLVAIIGVVGALRLRPDAGTDKLVDTGSAAFEGTQEFRDRFGDEAIVVLAKGDLKRLVLTDNVLELLQLEACLSGNAPPNDAEFPEVCREIAALGATRVVFGPATFLNQSAGGAAQYLSEQAQRAYAEAQRAGRRAARRAARQGLDEAEQQAAASAAAQAVLGKALTDFQDVTERVGELGLPSLGNRRFVRAIVFDPRRRDTPKSRFGYLFPSEEGALISIRLEPGIDNDTRREAIELIRTAVDDPAFAIEDTSYEISGVPVVVEGLADKLGSEILLLLAIAVVVMALMLGLAFGPPLRLLPLLVAAGAAAMAFGLLSLVGGSLTMASVAVLPVVIGLGVDYAIQLQARFREAAASGERPPAAAVIASVRGGPMIGTAALATAVGFLALVLSPIPMVREFALALVVGIVSALAIALTAGLAALSVAVRRPGDGRPRGGVRFAGGHAARDSLAAAGERIRRLGAGARRLGVAAGKLALGAAISRPGRELVLATVLAAVGWAVGTRTEVVSDIRELVPGDLPALESVDELQAVTGVSGELDVIVRGDDVTSPEAITWMRDFKARVLEQHGFGGKFPDCRAEGTELCPGPALSDLFGATGEPSQGRIDSVLGVVPDYFLQAILSRPEGAEEVASIAFLIPVMPLDEQEALIDAIRAELDPPEGLTTELVGLPVLAADANAELSGSRYWVALAGLGAVAIVLLAVYRSPGRALVPLIPIALATGWSALVLALIGMPLNPMSATLGALVIAVTTEFSVILAARYHEERVTGATIGESLRRTYSRTGAAVLVSGLTSIAGFGVLIASGITMLRDFGLVTVVDLSVALAGVMLVLPAALVWAESGFRPLGALAGRLRRRRQAVPEPGSAG
jgi:predicted RND superfamily exporter protein